MFSKLPEQVFGKAVVIIPVHNDEVWLGKSLGAVMPVVQQMGWEVVVVDDASTDHSARIAETAGARVIRLAENCGVSATRNIGARETMAPILVFVDSDIVPEPGCLVSLVSNLATRPEIHAVGAYPLPGDLSPDWSAHFVGLRSAWGYHWNESEEERPFSSIQSECGAIRREVFEELDGFSERHGGVGMEEFHMSHEMERKGYGHLLLRSAAYRHHYKKLSRRCLALIDRTARWVPLVLHRKKFESRGAVGTPDAAFSSLLSFIAVILLLAGFLESWFWLLALGIFLIQGWVEKSFLEFAHRLYGWRMTIYAFGALQPYNLAIGIGFIRGLLRCLRKSEDQHGTRLCYPMD